MGWIFGDSPQQQAGQVNQQLDQKEKAYNDYINMIKGMVEGTGYDFFGPKTTSSSGTSNTVSNTEQFTRPEVLPGYQKMEGMWKKILEGRLSRPTGLPPGYAERAVADINDTYAGAESSARNMAARRGLSGEASFGAVSPIASARAGKIADLRADLPLKSRELQNQDVDMAAKIAQIFGLGQRTSGTTRSTTNSSQKTTGPANINEYLSYLGLLQPFDRPIVETQPRQGALGGILGTTGSVIAIL